MKYIFTALFSTVIIVGHGQNIDDLKQRVLSLEEKQKEIQLNLSNSHKQFQTGTWFLVGGVVTSAAALLIHNERSEYGLKNWDNGKPLQASPVLLAIGGGMILAGTIIHIDAHKWIGRAGNRHGKK